MRKIIFRVDGNSEIGLGHFYRILALADLVREEFDCFCAILQPNEFIETQILKMGIGLIRLDQFDFEKLSGNKDTERVPFDLAQHLKGNEIVVLDGYQFDNYYQKKIKEFGCKLVYIDDVYKECPFADVIINHALSASPSKYRNTNAKILLGPDYALLRKEFLEVAKKIIIKNKFDTVFLCFGGADVEDLAFKITSFLINDSPFKAINILISSSYRGVVENFNRLSAMERKIIIHKNISASEIIKVMVSSDFSVISASNIAYECACTNLPFVIGHYVDHQIQFYSSLKDQQNVVGVGKWQNVTPSTLLGGIKELIDGYSPKAKGFIDGMQQKRFIDLFKSIST